jgi:hypothetical protein
VLKSLFKPTTPFSIVAMNYFANATAAPDVTTSGGLETIPIKIVVLAVGIFLLSAIFLFGSSPDYSAAQGGQRIRVAPYNLPFIGHIVAAIWSIDAFLRSNR